MERARRAWRHASLILALLCPVVVRASADRPNLSGWSATSYREGGWFCYQMKAAYANGALRFETVAPFVLSPRYARPIRRVALKLFCSSDRPTRFLSLFPFVQGAESSAAVLVDDSRFTATDGTERTAVVEFPSSRGVDAFRLCLSSGSGAGNWGVSSLVVFYGEPSAEDDAVLRDYASLLPAPANLRVASCTSSSLSLVADEVADASGYCFRVDRLVGQPLSVCREDFVDAPALSGGWQLGQVANVSLGAYEGTTYPDNKTASAEDAFSRALKIEAGASGDPVSVELLSPVVESPVVECSYVCKAAGVGDSVRLFGRTDAASPWMSLAEPFDVLTSKSWVTNAVDRALGVRQVRLVVSGAAGAFRNCGIDTLRLASGGDERRTTVTGGTETLSRPRLTLSGLVTGRYVFSVKAVGSAALHDSFWTDERLVDLSSEALYEDGFGVIIR